jgi:predicted permease
MQNIWQDFRFGVRLILRKPGFSALAILVLALGIGANTAIFTIINNLLLRPAPFENPEELLACYSKNTKNPDSFRLFSYPNYVDMRQNNSVFTDLMAHTVAMIGIKEGERVRRVFSEVVSSNYFRTFGVRIGRGREFTPEEEKPGASIPVVILSHEYWRRAGADPDALGKQLWINGRACTVIGIAPEEFTGRTLITSSGVWLPLGMYDQVINELDIVKKPLSLRSNYALFVIGRLKPGTTPAQADLQLGLLAGQLEKTYPKDNENQTILTHRLSRFSISSSPSNDSELTGLSVMLAAMAGLVLLIACFNLANMMLARGTARSKEFAMRLALGCGRLRLFRQMLVEGFTLSAAGAALGLLLAMWSTKLLIYSLNSITPITLVMRTAPDTRVFGAMLGFSVLSTLIFSLGPAWKAIRPDLVTSLKECTGEGVAAARHRLISPRNLLVVGQLALSLTLLTAAGLFVRGALKAGNADPGFRLDHGMLLELDAGLLGYEEAQGQALYRRIHEKLATLPGVESVSPAATAPFGMITLGRGVLRAEDAARDREEQGRNGRAVNARFNAVGADYFRTLGIPMRRGRPFSAAEDTPGSAVPVAIVDESLAGKLWPGENPLGKRIAFQADHQEREFLPMEIVGVVPSVLDSLLDTKNGAHVYVPFGQAYQSDMHFHLRTTAEGQAAETALASAIRTIVRSVDERMPLLTLRTMRAQLAESMDLWLFRTGARMFSVLGVLALFLAVVGVYGLKAYTVARRTREIGIRMALGATVQGTLWMLLKEGMRLTALGCGIGLALAFVVGRLLSNLLYDVSPTDALVFLSAPLILMLVSMLAAFIPARRAAKTDPLTALRYE